jgi:lipopolysaccharide transport system ATP-binding protein
VLRGRVSSLLEVGTGFHPELSGRDNIYMNGTILGMRKHEIDRKFDEIVEFSGVEKFLDTPVKRYSSGMTVRLAFAVAAHLEPEILIVDEVLAVLFVSHNMNAIISMCGRSLLMNQGTLAFDGDSDEAVQRYLNLNSVDSGKNSDRAVHRTGSGECRFTRFEATKDVFRPDEPKTFRFAIERVSGDLHRAHLSMHLMNENGIEVLHCDSRLNGLTIPGEQLPVEGSFRLESPWLKPGTYRMNVYLCDRGVVDYYESACHFEVSPELPYDSFAPNEAVLHGLVFADFKWDVAVPSDR